MPKRNRSSSASSSSLPLRLRAARTTKIRPSSSPLFCKRKTTVVKKMRSMEEIMADDRSLVLSAVVLGRPNPVQGRPDLSWTLLKSELKRNDSHRVKLTQALHVMHDCFAPSLDPVTHKDVAEDVIFNEHREFYTVVLEKGDKVASVANVRVHDDVLAEAPLVATAFEFQRQGMCRALMGEIEKWLRDCGVARLVLPSMQSTLSTWTCSSMGFEAVKSEDEKDELFDHDLMDFQDTVWCQKQLILNSREKKKKKNVKKNKKKNVRRDSGSSSDGSTISYEDQSSEVATRAHFSVDDDR